MTSLIKKIRDKYAESGILCFIKATIKLLYDITYYNIIFLKNNIQRKFISLPKIHTDLVLSLGPACRPAYHLHKMNLRKFSSPFDWMMCYDLATVVFFFEHGFENFFKDWKVDENHDGDCWRVVDNATGMVSLHHFPKVQPAENIHTAFIEKMSKRFERTKQAISTANTVCFVSNRTDDMHEFENFLHKMCSLFPHKNFIIFNTIHSNKEYWKKIHISNAATIYNIYFSDINKDGPKSPAGWMGNIGKWHKYISCITLTKSH